jgi:membrane-bound lytic murein transglycosylase B
VTRELARDIARTAAAVGVVVLAVLTALSPIPAGAQDDASSTDGLTAAELDGRVLSLAIELDGVDADLASGTERRGQLDIEVAAGQEAYRVGLDAENATRAALSRYAVAAYMAGEIVPPALNDELLRSGPGDLDNEGRRVLATTVHRQLTGQAREATVALDGIVAELDRDEAEAAELDQRLVALHSHRDELAGEVERARFDAGRVRAQEEAEAADRARRAHEDELRANTPRPVAHRSGVVPPRTVPPAIVALFQGEISFTALDAYWRAVSLTNAARPSCQIDWALIAAIGKVETGHATYRGTSLAADGSTNPTILGIALDGSNGTLKVNDTDGGELDGDPIADRAVGPKQFIPGTWRGYAADGNGDGVADPHNIYDSAVAAGNYLCNSAGGPIGQDANASRAVYAYNRSTAYNLEVLNLADRFRRVVDPSLPPRTPVTAPPPGPDAPPPASPDVPKVDPGPDPTSTTTTSLPSESTTTTTTTAPP